MNIDHQQIVVKPKKSVALSGITAGNTALCTVGKTGNDLHYVGYDILELAEGATFDEVAYLLIYGSLPNGVQLSGYKNRLRTLHGLSSVVRKVLEQISASELIRKFKINLARRFPAKQQQAILEHHLTTIGSLTHQ